MVLPLARTSAEAYLYMAMTPCDVCGGVGFAPASGPAYADGVLAGQYAGPCPYCGMPREYRFRRPDVIVPFAESDPVFGDSQPSELVDAGQWLLLADRIIVSVPDAPLDSLAGEALIATGYDLRAAAAAVDEVVKFIPAGGDTVPEDGLWTEEGRNAYRAAPQRFRRERLMGMMRDCRELASSFLAAAQRG